MLDMWRPNFKIGENGTDPGPIGSTLYAARYYSPEENRYIVNGPFEDMQEALESCQAAVRKFGVQTHIDVIRPRDAH